MRVDLPFGRGIQAIEVPETATVLRPRFLAPLEHPAEAVLQSLSQPLAGPPLRERVQAGQRVAIVISDVTRPVPNQLLLEPVLAELAASGVPDADIVIVNGTGLHRINTPAELESMLGAAIVERYAIVQHEARRPESLTRVGVSGRGVPVELCSAYVEADVRIVTGFVEPHLFAGYSGGAKGVLPGVAGHEIVMSNHGAANIAHSQARWCITTGNPIFEEIRALVALCPTSFLLNVTLDSGRRLTGVFAGDLEAAHDAAIAQAARQYQVEVPQLYDVVVVTNMGHPADTTLYQSVKGISAAATAVADGGAILLVAGCEEGVGSPEFTRFLAKGASPGALLREIEAATETRHDQWQIQVQAMAQARAAVHLYSQLARSEVEAAHLHYSEDASATLRALVEAAQAAGRRGSVLVMPHGQLTLPLVRGD